MGSREWVRSTLEFQTFSKWCLLDVFHMVLNLPDLISRSIYYTSQRWAVQYSSIPPLETINTVVHTSALTRQLNLTLPLSKCVSIEHNLCRYVHMHVCVHGYVNMYTGMLRSYMCMYSTMCM